MSVRLPDAFAERMRRLLEGEAGDFLASYGQPRALGLRVNTLKIDVGRFLAISPFSLEKIPWAEDGFYYGDSDRPGKHPYYQAGLYYIQEPSAMAPVELLRVEPGDRVLDLCAAPGGKSTQIAARLKGKGLLVANDFKADRVKALVKNLALAGVRNAVVTNASPEELIAPFRGYFDKILIDAPCSGEGMFRKDEEAAGSWAIHSSRSLMPVQRALLDAAALLLRPGGRIVYSTCTFAPEENEAAIARFLDDHPDFSVEPAPLQHGFAPGRPDWIGGAKWSGEETFSPASVAAVAGTARLWPHRLRGEGHFVAALIRSGRAAETSGEKAGPCAGKAGLDKNAASGGSDGWIGAGPASGRRAAAGSTGGKAGRGRRPSERSLRTEDLSPWFSFMAENLTSPIDGRWLLHGNALYWTLWDLPDLSGIAVARPGWFVGTLARNRFVPSQALAMGLEGRDALRRVDFSPESGEVARYLKGETLQIGEERILRASSGVPARGYCLVCVDGFPLGWGKWLDGMLKNEYPPGWRWT